jgi:hypothetical protein
VNSSPGTELGHRLDATLPTAGIAAGVIDGNDGNMVCTDSVDNGVRETADENLSRTPKHFGGCHGHLLDSMQRLLDTLQESITRSQLTGFVPGPGIGNVLLGLGTDD